MILPLEPLHRGWRSTAAGPSGNHLQYSIPGPPRKLAALKQARLCRSALRPPNPEISVLQGCGRRAPAAVRGLGLSGRNACKADELAQARLALQTPALNLRRMVPVWRGADGATDCAIGQANLKTPTWCQYRGALGHNLLTQAGVGSNSL